MANCESTEFSKAIEGDEPAIQRFRQPTDRHSAFAPLIGNWSVEMTTRDAEGNVTSSSNSIHAEKRFIGDGRYVREDISGEIGGGQHEKLSILGFNNIRSRYEYSTADNFDAVILLYTSAPGSDLDPCRIETFAKYVYAGDEQSPVGTLVTIRTVIEIESDDRHILRNYYNAPGADEYLFLEYIYSRVSGP